MWCTAIDSARKEGLQVGGHLRQRPVMATDDPMEARRLTVHGRDITPPTLVVSVALSTAMHTWAAGARLLQGCY